MLLDSRAAEASFTAFCRLRANSTSTLTYPATYSNWPSPSTSRKHTPSKPPSQPHQALALGLGSLFNHSRHNQNIGWRRDTTNTCIVYTALRDIGVGEELCINYGIGVWFEDVDALENQERGEPVNGDGSADKSGGWRPDGMAGDEGGEREEMVMMRVLGELVGD